MAESFTAQQTTSMHSRKIYYTTRIFITRHKVLLHSRKVSHATETGEKFLLREKLEKSLFCGRNWRKVPSTAETEDKHHILPAVSMLLANEAQFAHKLSQIKLQFDRSQLPYSEYSGPIPQEAAQPTLTTKRPTTYIHIHLKFQALVFGCLEKSQDFTLASLNRGMAKST